MKGNIAEAAVAFERAQTWKDAYRNWRNAGKWEKTVRYAVGSEKAALEWTINFETIINQRPPNFFNCFNKR